MKRKTTWNSETDDAVLKELWQEHQNLAYCAKLMGHSLGTIYARAARLKIGDQPRRIAKQPRYEEKDNPLCVAKWILGARLTETADCFILDNTPATLATVMKAANRDRKSVV